MKRPQFSLGPSRDGASDVQLSTGGGAAREGEQVSLLHPRHVLIDGRLQARDVASLDTMRRRGRTRRGGELALSDVELVLDPDQEVTNLFRRGWAAGLSHPEDGTELVEGAEGADAGGILGYALTAGKARLATVPGSGIEPRATRASGLHRSSSSGDLSPWTGQNEMCSTSVCYASNRHSRQKNPLRSLHATIPSVSILPPVGPLSLEERPPLARRSPTPLLFLRGLARGAAKCRKPLAVNSAQLAEPEMDHEGERPHEVSGPSVLDDRLELRTQRDRKFHAFGLSLLGRAHERAHRVGPSAQSRFALELIESSNFFLSQSNAQEMLRRRRCSARSHVVLHNLTSI